MYVQNVMHLRGNRCPCSWCEDELDDLTVGQARLPGHGHSIPFREPK